MGVTEVIVDPLCHFLNRGAGRLPPEVIGIDPWFNRQTVANATMDAPDVTGFVDMFGGKLIEALEKRDLGEVLFTCATPLSAVDLEWFLGLQEGLPESLRNDLRAMRDSDGILMYFLVGMKRVLVSQLTGPLPDSRVFFTLPKVDMLGSGLDYAEDIEVLSALFAEWVYGGRKSRQARDFIERACGKVARKNAA